MRDGSCMQIDIVKNAFLFQAQLSKSVELRKSQIKMPDAFCVAVY